MARDIIFLDTEVGVTDRKIHDIGAIRNGIFFHSTNLSELASFSGNAEFVCGHNIIAHDLKYIHEADSKLLTCQPIDTLYLSPLLFPKRPYHHLLKDDKLQVEQLNNPLNDAEKARQLFYDEVNAFIALDSKVKQIYCCLLYHFTEFNGFFNYVNFKPYNSDIEKLIKDYFNGKICQNADILLMIKHYPIELAYALALIGTKDYHSVTPPWLTKNFPKIDNVIKFLCGTPCTNGCDYCNNKLNIHKRLYDFFEYNNFRTYNGEPLQERATQAAVDGKSLLAVFPTGGGKSVTFQLPALMAGESVHGLTVIISPLLSLMKDQVDNLSEKGLVDAVTINGLLSPIERAEALERVRSGLATILYISPEQLRSPTIEKLLLSRNVVRFVIDEAHCFSAWGQDFRVDYLYIGDFIREYQKAKQLKNPIPVSCFTATAKQKVISDICEYFRRKLDLSLELFTTSADRKNLHYTVLHCDTEEEKYNTLRALIGQKKCPTIVYVSRTRRTVELAQKLTSDGFVAKPFNGQMSSSEKIANQEAFIKNEIQVIVATSAFGMGVDKKDVKLVIHYDISDSLENYIQEAGRAGRNDNIQAECFVLYNDTDLDKHFILLNQSKLSINDIQQVWKGLKDFTKDRPYVCCSPLEIARQAGWNESVKDIETRVKTALSALENAGYIKRGRNMPKVFATSIRAKDMAEASFKIEHSALFDEKNKTNAKRIIKSLISSRSIAEADNDDAESRVDYLSDMLGIPKDDVINSVNLMRQEGLLADASDMTAYILKSDTENRSEQILNRFARLEEFLLNHIDENGSDFSLKELNEAAIDAGIPYTSVKSIRTLLYYFTIKGYISKGEKNNEEDEVENNQRTLVTPTTELSRLMEKFNRRIDICHFIVETLYNEALNKTSQNDEILVQFSLVGLWNRYNQNPKSIFFANNEPTLADVEDALLYLSKIGAMKLEGGFLVLYNGMQIKRVVTDNKVRYKADDYKYLSEYYKQKIQQIHIVGEYANLMVKDYDAALQFVHDYFEIDYKKFISKYFKGERAAQIEKNITPRKYNKLFGELSEIQLRIVNDAESKYIVVAAGPGSGKTRILVHKLASLLLLEDVKHEQLLMLTFSRAAATEFKKRLISLIGNAANFVEIKTFHSYCFDLLGKIGSLDGAENVVHDAAQLIANGEVEKGRITKTVLVIDEAQDMDADEFALVKALMQNNDDMRIIAVGDDDQNIYEFRGSDSANMQSLINDFNATRYEMIENYRSTGSIVALANTFVQTISDRMKKTPIKAIKSDKGTVTITRYTSNFLEEPIVNQIVTTYHSGNACVLTTTNEEALRVVGLLTKKGIRAKLIQTMGGMRLYNLAEVRFFLKCVDRKIKASPVISADIWTKAKRELQTTYKESVCLNNVLNMLSEFEKVNTYTKYRTDLEEFIKESAYEDFYADEKQTVFVSTIHKSKGREFDSVYILLSNIMPNTDEIRRQLYVGLTRAKDNLYIHCNTGIFDNIHLSDVQQLIDTTRYSAPEEIVLQLGHKDVVLDFFKNKKEIIFKLRSGQNLTLEEEFLTAELDNRTVRVAKLSKSCVAELGKLQLKGYVPTYATVRFVVAWKGENDTEETAVLLADLHFSKRSE